MELKLINEENKLESTVSAPDNLFARDYNEALVHQLVKSYLANGRSATRSQKDRSEVKKSTKKPWKQKGTGRARVGAASSPLWRGGGQIFPNRSEDSFAHKVNRKMYRAGICTILSQLVRDGRLLAIDTITVETPKTKTFFDRLKNLELTNVMIITDEIEDNLYLSSRNLPNVKVVEANSADPVSLLYYEKILFTKSGIQKLEGLMA